jgi:di/tricarboxylate transporter
MPDSFPALPNDHALFALLLTVIALVLFTRNRIPLEVSSLCLLGLVALLFTLYPFRHEGEVFEATELFAGFGHEALVTVCALMVLGQGLVQTGALEPFGRILTRAWSVAPFLSALATLLISAILSAFVNNTPIVVLLLPVLISVSLRTKKSPAKILMPMGFATIVGGMGTTIGTSTNLLVVSVASDLGLPRMQMFDFFLPAALASAVAIIYLWLVAPLLLDDKEMPLGNSSPRLFQARLHIEEDSKVVGKTLAEAKEMVSDGISIVRLRRGDNVLMLLPDIVLQAGDRLRVQDTAGRIRAAAEAMGATLYSGEHEVSDDHPLKAEDQSVAEIAVVGGSALDGANLRYTYFLERYQLAVLALHRAGKDIWKPQEKIMDVTLQQGDVLLVQGQSETIKKLSMNPEFLVLDASEEVAHAERSNLALFILLVTVGVAAFGWIPIAISSVTGAIAMLLTGILNIKSALKSLSASVIFVVAASLALGHALEVTGASRYLTDVFLFIFREASAPVMVSALMLLIGILTNIVSNNAAAVIGTPVAIGIAQQLGVSHEPFILAILFGANLSFATPMSYKTNLLVMNAGNYTFNDFVKVGLPLALLMWLSLSFILSMLYL